MPIYQYKCSDGHITKYFCSVGKRSKDIRCKECDKVAKHIFSAPSIKTSLDLSSESSQDRKKRYGKIVRDKNFGDR